MIKFTKNIFNDLIFMIRFIFNDKKTIIQLLCMSLMPVLIPVILLPLNISFTMVIQFSLISCITIIFGITTYNYRYSTLYENNRTTSNNSWTFYTAKYIFIVILSVIIAILLIGILSFLNLLDILMRNFFGMSGEENRTFYDFSYLPWLAYLVVTIELATVTFAISFLIKSLSKSSKTYYMFMLCLLILIIPFGSMLNIYFQPIGTIYESGFQWQGESSAIWVTVKNSVGMGFVSKENTLMARIFFIPSLIFPFYSTGALFNTIGSHLMLDINTNTMFGYDLYQFESDMGYSDVFQWYSISDLSKNSLLENINNINSVNYLWQYKLVELMPLIDVIIFGTIGSIISKLKPNH